MQTLIETMRDYLGAPSFYVDGVLDIGLCVEYLIASLLLIFTISSVFKFVRLLLK